MWTPIQRYKWLALAEYNCQLDGLVNKQIQNGTAFKHCDKIETETDGLWMKRVSIISNLILNIELLVLIQIVINVRFDLNFDDS